MLASQIISDVQNELLDAGLFWSPTELLRLLNRGELDYVNKTRILESTAQLSLTQGRLDYPVPSNWVSARAVFHKINNADGTSRWVRIYPTNLEKNAQQRENFLTTSTDNQGQPRRYFVWQKSIWLDKAPSADYATSLYLFFKAKPVPLTDVNQSINLDDSLSEALTAYILWKAWKKEKEADEAADNERIYLQYVAEGRKWVKKQAGDERKRIDIDSPIPFEGSNNPFDPLAG